MSAYLGYPVDIPKVPFGPEETPPRLADAHYYREAAAGIRRQYRERHDARFSGSNVTETVARLCEAAAESLEKTQAIDDFFLDDLAPDIDPASEETP